MDQNLPNNCVTYHAPDNSQRYFEHINDALRMGTTFSPILFNLSNDSRQDIEFTTFDRTTVSSVFRDLNATVRSIMTTSEYGSFHAILRNLSIANRIIECIVCILTYLTTYIDKNRAFYNAALQQYHFINNCFQLASSPFMAFFQVQHAYTIIDQYHKGLTRVIETVHQLRICIEKLCQTYVIPEIVYRKQQQSPQYLRLWIQRWVRIAREFEFHLEIVKHQLNFLVVQSFMRIWQNV